MYSAAEVFLSEALDNSHCCTFLIGDAEHLLYIQLECVEVSKDLLAVSPICQVRRQQRFEVMLSPSSKKRCSKHRFNIVASTIKEEVNRKLIELVFESVAVAIKEIWLGWSLGVVGSGMARGSLS